MFEINVYSIYDIDLDIFERPFYAINDKEAMSAIRPVIEDEKSQFFHNPERFVLWRIGTFNKAKGIFSEEEDLEKRESLGNLVTVYQASRPKTIKELMAEEDPFDELD